VEFLFSSRPVVVVVGKRSSVFPPEVGDGDRVVESLSVQGVVFVFVFEGLGGGKGGG